IRTGGRSLAGGGEEPFLLSLACSKWPKHRSSISGALRSGVASSVSPPARSTARRDRRDRRITFGIEPQPFRASLTFSGRPSRALGADGSLLRFAHAGTHEALAGPALKRVLRV